MDRNFRDLPCKRIEMDEQWQYVAFMESRNNQSERGDLLTSS